MTGIYLSGDCVAIDVASFRPHHHAQPPPTEAAASIPEVFHVHA